MKFKGNIDSVWLLTVKSVLDQEASIIEAFCHLYQCPVIDVHPKEVNNTSIALYTPLCDANMR
jgi:hypothetical protein